MVGEDFFVPAVFLETISDVSLTEAYYTARISVVPDDVNAMSCYIL
ncbi:MAG: hypothetical protein OXF79_04465 [Chloroflexi bacterium]|nr:hypothetical protein [Chloroflexota bacterium]